MTKTILDVQNVNKYFGKKHILKDVSFTMEEGEILGFIGPNGAGKTTMIKLILGLQKIHSGEIKINSFDIEKDFNKAIYRVGAIVENPDLYMYLSGMKNLEQFARLYPNVTKERVKEVIKIVGMEKRINDKVAKYSLGMRQRLGIAQAILHKPNILILDEPTNGLDPEGIIELRKLLQDLAKKEKMAIMISSHNLAELESFCTKVCIIKAGEILVDEDIKNLKTNTKESVYFFEVSDTKEIKKLYKEAEILNKNEFSLKANKDEINKIIKKLFDKKISIYEIKKEELSLEEAFLKQIGGNIID